MDSIIEVQRQTHEEIEHFERALYQILAKPAPLHQGKVQAEHRASQILERISARVNTLDNLYQNDDTRKQEIEAISGSSKADDLSEFYSRLGKIQEHHAKYPDGIVDGFELELLALTEDPMAEEVDEDYAEEDRTFNAPLCCRLLVLHARPQRSGTSSLERNRTGNTWICTPTTRHTTTSGTSPNASRTYSTWTF